MIDIHATALTGLVLVAVIIGAWLVEVARGDDGSPYSALGAVGGIAYIVIVAVLRRARLRPAGHPRRRTARHPAGGLKIVLPDPGRSLPRATTRDAAAASLPAMAHTGQIIHNPVSGERITFLQTSHDTGGEKLEIELELAPDGHVPGAHVHPEQEERFHVLEGEMKFRLGMRKIVAGPGETVVVPAGRLHRFANNGDGLARARVEVVPALDMEQLFETTVELALEGNTTRKGMPKPLHLALFVDRFRREVRAPFPPAAIVRALMAPLAALARRRGHAERYAPTADVIAFPAPVEAEVALAA